MPLAVVLPLEITQAVARLRTYQGGEDHLDNHVAVAFRFTLLTFGVFCGFAMLAAPWLNAWLLDSRVSPGVLVLAAVLLLLNGIYYFVQNELRWSLRAGGYAWTSFVSAVVTASLAVLFLAVLGWGLIGLYGALAMGLVAGNVLALRQMPGLMCVQWRWQGLAEMLKFSTPLAISSMFLILATTADRLMVARLLDLDSLGRYGVALRISGLAMLAFQGFQLAALPAIVGRTGQDKRAENLELSLRLFLVIAFAMALMLAALAREILGLLATATYTDAAFLVPLMLVGTVFAAIYPFAPGLWLKGYTVRMAALGIVVALLGFGSSSWLIMQAGVFGAALACALTGLIYAVMMLVASDRVYPVSRRYGPIVIAAVVFCAGAGILSWMLQENAAVQWRVALAMPFIVASTWILSSESERDSLFQAAHARWSGRKSRW